MLFVLLLLAVFAFALGTSSTTTHRGAQGSGVLTSSTPATAYDGAVKHSRSNLGARVRVFEAGLRREANGPSGGAHTFAVVVAAETAGNAGDQIVLGLTNQGLEQTAVKVGGRTLLHVPN